MPLPRVIMLLLREQAQCALSPHFIGEGAGLQRRTATSLRSHGQEMAEPLTTEGEGLVQGHAGPCRA